MSRPNLFHDEGEWISHNARRMPVHPETEIVPAFGFGVSKQTYLARQLNWAGFNDETRIVSYKIIRAVVDQ